ncbi:MAG: M23 family metallopeptidase [Candidatus Buchananbacteria bacterium]
MRYSLPVNTVDIRSAPFHQTHTSMKHCIDFAVPIGTPVMAIANGVVLHRESRFSKSYRHKKYTDKANYIEILHADGCVSCYTHLQWRSLKVRIGQKIKRGQIIALSGNTGYATYPHLHFGLYDKNGNNIPAEFN